MKTIRLALTGTSPLIMHSDKLSNPLDPATIAHKKLTSKRNRTEENQVAIARSEYENSLYLKDGKVVIPTINLAASIIDGAKQKGACVSTRNNDP